MANKLYEEDDIRAIAEAIRLCTGGTETYKVSEMKKAVEDLREFANTYLLMTQDGQEIPAVVVEDVTMFNAMANDIRLGKTAVNDEGIVEGTKIIPAYHTTTGSKAIPAGKDFEIKISDQDRYNYTKLQAIICPYNQSPEKSVAADKVVIEDNVYAVNSTISLSTITLDHNNKTIKLGITNNGVTPYIIRYFTLKEEE